MGIFIEDDKLENTILISVSGVLLALLILILTWKLQYKLRQKWFAFVMSRVVPIYNIVTAEPKEKVFGPLADVVSVDEELRAKKQIRILEIGAGSGGNLQHYPPGSRLILLDLNAEFEGRLRDRLAEFPQLQLERLVHGRAEDMYSIPSNSIDAVVSSTVLCSVQNVPQVLKEVRRVLVPGGKYYFIEHVLDKDNKFRAFIQWSLTTFGTWPFLFCGCHLSRDIGKMLKKSDFSSVDYETYHIHSNKFSHSFIYFFMKAQIYGTATK